MTGGEDTGLQVVSSVLKEFRAVRAVHCQYRRTVTPYLLQLVAQEIMQPAQLSSDSVLWRAAAGV
jgi:hypothetical protein